MNYFQRLTFIRSADAETLGKLRRGVGYDLPERERSNLFSALSERAAELCVYWLVSGKEYRPMTEWMIEEAKAKQAAREGVVT